MDIDKLTHIEPFQLGGGVTIDSATGQYDNGFLACARTGWSNPKSHSNFVQAATNLSGYSISGTASPLNVHYLVLVGHGTQGLISTGDGLTPRTSQGYISAGTYGSWSSYFSGVKGHGVFLTLCGCDCGAGAAGAQFLYQLATLLNMPVQGRTGLVYLTCPGAIISYENGSVWQVAQPGIMPTPIAPPAVTVKPGPTDQMRFASRGAVPIDSIDTVELQLHGRGVRKVDRTDAISLMASANLDYPYGEEGSLSAILTTTIIISFDNGQSAKLNCYNDRILQDADNPKIYYRCTPAFTDQIRRLRG